MAESKGMKRIKRMARMAGIDPSIKTITNVRMFLEVYRNLNRVAGHLKTMAKPIPMREACPLLFEELLQPNEISEEIVEELECRFIADGWFQDVARDTLEDVKGFGDDGKMYHQILDSYYFKDSVTDEEEYLKSLCLCRTGFYDKKREATLLYGTFFWGKLLDEWPDAAKEMREIEERCGRGDEITRGLKMGRYPMIESMMEEPDVDDDADDE